MKIAVPMESSNGCQVDCSLASSQGEKWAKDKAWLPSTCLPGVRALVACNGYSGKVIAIEDHRFCIDESRVLRHASKYQQLPAYIAQLDNYTEMNARNLLRQIVKHVQALHEHRIVHRNLNPENVYVFQGTVQLQGLRYMHALSNDNAPIPVVALTGWPEGSHAFCPPKGELSHSESADIWSLGILLYFLLVGMLPYRGSNCEIAKAMGWIQYDMTIPSPAAQNLMEHMLHANPRHRFTIQQVLAHEWMSETDERLAAFDLSLTKSIVGDWSKLDPKCQNCSQCRRLLAFTS